jgi:phosphonate transport system substrate-binding protein
MNMQVLIASLLALVTLHSNVQSQLDKKAPSAKQPANTAKSVQDRKPLTLTFGIYQSEKATVMYKKFTPVLEFMNDDLDQRLNRPVDVKLTIFKNYEEGIEALVKGEIDFARFGPASYITAKNKQHGVELLGLEVENGERRFKGAIIVQKDSPYTTLAELKGKRFAFGDANSTIGRYLAQAELVKAGLHIGDFPKFEYLGRHDKVASAVEMGDFDAGSLRLSALEDLNKKGTLRVLATFDNVGQPWVARAGMDRSVIDGLQQSLFSIKDPAILKELKITGVVPTTDAEYAFVRDGMRSAEEFTNPTRGN